ncbi:MAG: lytic transglycosylase domain-containing protein [Deltaproteobacteria bacterium]|nr:lytic transglycosylase domain-containing protein [Deltaproteobacteria bacterium]MBW2413987.1 lytic transglycosylase domain-containing protein [Deltaproteobacteria bacterium]
MSPRIPPLLALLLLLLHPLGERATADVWVYEDEHGNVHFSDRRQHEGYERKSLTRRRAARGHKTVRFDGPTNRWDGVIAHASRDYRMDPALIKAVIHAESLFDAYAVSRAGARGLMQLMPATARSIGVDNAFDPWQNIRGGTRYLRYLMRRFEGNLELSLAAYNAGADTVLRYGGIPPYRETRRYVKRVLHFYRRYDADFQ